MNLGFEFFELYLDKAFKVPNCGTFICLLFQKFSYLLFVFTNFQRFLDTFFGAEHEHPSGGINGYKLFCLIV